MTYRVHRMEQCGVKEYVFILTAWSGLMHCLGSGYSDLQARLLITTIHQKKIMVDSPPL